MRRSKCRKTTWPRQLPAALAETVSLAIPFTMSRIEGRDEAPAILREMAESLRIREQEFIANDDEQAFVTFVCTGQGGRGWSVPRPHQGLGGHLFGGRPLRPALAVREAGPRPTGRL